MSKISDIKAFEIIDSRGNPTIKAEVILDNGITGGASVPSGASKGKHEAVELRDNDKNRYDGMGTLKSIDVIENQIAGKLKGMDPINQRVIDEVLINLDGTENKSKLGANSILAVSLAVARVASKISKQHLFEYIGSLTGNKCNNMHLTPMFNVINGGLHGCGKFNFQEFLLIPKSGLPFNDALRMGVEIYQKLKHNLKDNNLIYSVGDEGGFTPQFSTNEEVMDFLIDTINHSNYSYGNDVFLGLDFASSSYYQDGFYMPAKFGVKYSKEKYIEYLISFSKKYSLFSLEDGLSEDDWDGWISLTKTFNDHTIIIGDDLLVTNKKRLQKAIETKACNGIIIKLNQIGTLSETLEVVKLAQDNNIKIIISHRSGETNDDFIADLAVGVNADLVKFGAPARGERVIKYNKLLWFYHKFIKNPKAS